jgi:hypothetical protein
LSKEQVTKYVKDAGLSKGGHLGVEIESHHLMEDHQMEQFGVPRDKGLCVALDKQDHVDFTRWMRGILDRKTPVDIADLYDLHREMYRDNGNPEYVPKLRKFLNQWKDVIRKRYQDDKVPGRRSPNFRERQIRFLDSL